MAIIGDAVGYSLLRAIAPRKYSQECDEIDSNDTKLEQFFGEDIFDIIHGKSIIDFGCGTGNQAVQMAKMGAGKVIGIDIQESRLATGRKLAEQLSVDGICSFAAETNERADIIISKDACEHFFDTVAVLRQMSKLLKPDGFVLAAFGPTWLHPYGGHLFSVFPWAHLIFSENALIRWRSDFKSDGATRFCEVEGGLNQLTIANFERSVEKSPFRFEWIDTVPIKGIFLFKHKILREVGSSLVRCKLKFKGAK